MNQIEGVVRLDDVIQVIRDQGFLDSFENSLIKILKNVVPNISLKQIIGTAGDNNIFEDEDRDNFIESLLIMRMLKLEEKQQLEFLTNLTRRVTTGLVLTEDDCYEKDEVVSCIFEILKDLFNLREIEISDADKRKIFRIIDACSN